MRNQVYNAVIFLDMVLLVMTAAWILFGISAGIDFIELVYNYIYVIIALVAFILNIKLLTERE